MLGLPQNPSVAEVVIRLARPEERLRWDGLMAERHELGFLRFVGRGLRYVAVLGTLWIGLAGWQAGALKCRPRDRFVGWKAPQQYERLHLVASNTRLLVLPEPGAFPNPGSWFVGGMLRRLSDDWKAAYGHPLELAETLVDPEKHHGTVYRASNWAPVGLTKGYARGRGGYTDPHGKLKEMVVYPLGRSSVARLCATEPHPDWAVARTAVDVTEETLPSLLEELQRVPDFRHAQGRRHKLATVLAICVLARLAGKVGCDATSRYAKTMPQEHLAALDARRDRISDRFIPPSRATIHRVMVQADSDEVQAAANRWAQAHPVPDRSALAADGKRINGVNRSGAVHHETATLVTHAEGIPIACRMCHEAGGEKAAVLAVLEDVEIRGSVITMDALHTSRNTADAIVRTHGAHYLFTVKGNAPETFETLKATNWERDAQRRFCDVPEKPLHGRWDTRSIECNSPLDNLFTIPHVRQMFRITRERKHVRSGKTSIEHAYGITSLSHAEASPERLLSLNRGHWAIENKNHRRRDTAFREDACLMRTGHGPANNTAFSNLALAIILTAGFDRVPAATDHFESHRDDALKHVLAKPPRKT